MPPLPRLAAKVVRFHWKEVGHVSPRRVPVVDVQVQTDDGAWTVGLEVLPATLEVHRYTAIRSPLVGVIATEAAQAFVDERREKIRALFAGAESRAGGDAGA